MTFVAPLADGGSPITGYTVTSIPAGGVDSYDGATGLAHVLTGLANGTSYTFTVIATNANGQSPSSAPSNAVTPATVPDPPTTVSAVPGDSSATVTFLAPESDGGSPILGYLVISDPAGGIDSNAGSTGTTHAITGLVNGLQLAYVSYVGLVIRRALERYGLRKVDGNSSSVGRDGVSYSGVMYIIGS